MWSHGEILEQKKEFFAQPNILHLCDEILNGKTKKNLRVRLLVGKVTLTSYSFTT